MRRIYRLIIIGAFLCVSCTGQELFWEDLSNSQKSNILSSCKSQKILELYEGKFVLADNESTVELLRDIVMADDNLLPLSFYLFNNILITADGALAEMAGKYCIEFSAKHPEYFLLYFTRERERRVKDPVWRLYAQFIGYELYFKNLGTSDLNYTYYSFKEVLTTGAKGNVANGKTLEVFWQLVDETIKDME